MVLLVVQIDCTHNTSFTCFSPIPERAFPYTSCPHLPLFAHLFSKEEYQKKCIRTFFFQATLVALEKKSGGVRPIAVECTLRKHVAKVTGNPIVDEMADLLSPRQLGYGVCWGKVL